jgi:FkbH-like protein
MYPRAVATNAPTTRSAAAGGEAEPAPGSDSANALGAPIKLVIWDLDETLWEGTLSEGPVTLLPERAEIVRELNRRGIVSSICSKNDLAAARARLQQEDLWEEFVFPSIGWSPKGPRVARIVEDMQLRAPNVLFVDDNFGNLQEARHYTPELQIADERILSGLLAAPQAAGKDDRALTRLAQYRVLERKLSDRDLASASNEEFLRSCDIRVELLEPTAGDSERLLELINRSNQLNFTKSRLSEHELAALCDGRDGRETRCVRVHDRYGDYGIAGFYSLAGGRLSDFVFSCRILHMGVEQWLYARLGEPELTVVGEVASTLEDGAPVDWIALADGSPETGAERRGRRSRSRILLKGGCDLFLLNGFLGGSIRTEFTYPSSTGAEVHGDHTEVLRRSSKELVRELGPTIDRLPFLDRAAYASEIVRRPKAFGVVILSVLMDYTQGLYRMREGELVVPYGQHDVDATDPAQWPELERRWGRVGIDRAFLEWFAERFEYEGALGRERFQENVRWLRELLPAQTKLVLINGAEVGPESDREPDRHLHHRRMNQALDEVVAELAGTSVCDVRGIVTSPENLRDNIRHYDRQSYLRMAESLKAIVGEDLAIEQRPLAMRAHKAQRRLLRSVQRAAVRLGLR